jgi:hypothetical protein
MDIFQKLYEIENETGGDVSGIKKLIDSGQVTTATDIKPPDPKQSVQEIELFNRFNRDYPNYADGGMLVKPSADGRRPGYAVTKRKASEVKMSVSQALSEIFKDQTNFLNRDELKNLVDEKTGFKISKNILKASRYPILKKVTYRTSEVMKEKAKKNKAAGKLTKKESFVKAQKKKQRRINLFKTYLGVDIEIGRNNEFIGLDDELRKKVMNASKRYREKGLNTKGLETFNDPKFFKFFNNEYQTAEDRIKSIAKNYGYSLEEWNTLSTEQKKRLYNEDYQNKVRIKKGEIPGGLSIDEIVDQVYSGKKLPGGGPAAKTLDSVYETLFRQEYDRLAEKGDPFSKADLSRNVEIRLREIYGRPGQEFPEALLPGRSKYTDASAKNYFQYIDPRTQGGSAKSKIFSDYELELFDGNTAASLNKTKTQEKIFDIITKGPVEIDELSKQLEMTPNKIRSEINKLLTNVIVRTDRPVFLKGKEDLFSSLINNLEATETLDKDWNRSLKYLIYSQVPDREIQKQMFNKIDEFDSFLKIIQEKFPGIQVNFDHPASYTALKNQNFKEFLNITPIAKDINILKATFDSRSNQNLLAMNEAKAAGNNQLFNEFLDKQTKLENTWSKLTGGQSSLGKIRIEGVEDFGTIPLTDPNKNLFTEFRDNINIRQNIAQNISDDLRKDIVEVLPRKDRETSVLKTIENVTDPNLIKQDRDALKLIESQLAAIGCPGKAKGGRVGFNEGTNYQRCILKGIKEVQTKSPDQLTPGAKANFRKITGTMQGARLMKNVLGPAALAYEALFAAPFAVYDYASGRPGEDILKNFLTLGIADQKLYENELKRKFPDYGKAQYLMDFDDRISEYERQMGGTKRQALRAKPKLNIALDKFKNDPTRLEFAQAEDPAAALFENFLKSQEAVQSVAQDRANLAAERGFGESAPQFDLGNFSYGEMAKGGRAGFESGTIPGGYTDDAYAYLREMDDEIFNSYKKYKAGGGKMKYGQYAYNAKRMMFGPFGVGVGRSQRAGGGIAKLAGIDDGPPPEKGPNPQGLQGLLNRVKKV